MKRLLIANTYYQLITALQLKYTIFKNDYIAIGISDHSKNADLVVKELKKIAIFDEAILLKSKEIDTNKSKLDRYIDTFRLSFDFSTEYDKLFDSFVFKEYDELLFYNIGYLCTDAALSYFGKKSHNIRCSMFEEGILSYDFTQDFFVARKFINAFRTIRNKKKISELLNDFYCHYPQLYRGNLNPVKIPLISTDSEVSAALQKIFMPDLSNYSQKYIFFTSVYDFEGGKPVGEYELVCKIADLVGKYNLLVKTHPRDTRTIYIDNGFNVDKNSSIPWEAIQLSGDFSDKVFMTINSGSVLSGSTISEKPVRTYYMYKLCDISGNESCQKNARDIESLLQNEEMKDILKTVHIAEKLEDIL